MWMALIARFDGWTTIKRSTTTPTRPGCRWPTTIEIPVGDDWQPGFHLVTLTARGAPAGRDVALDSALFG
jgi:hypothetical protein